MAIMTATEFSRNIKKTLDRLEFGGEEIIIMRNNHKIARLLPGSHHMTALEAMSDLYRTLPKDAGKNWGRESGTSGLLFDEIRDPWDS